MQVIPHTLVVLAFTLGGEAYGIEFHQVQELQPVDAVTWLEGSRALIHLRGQVVPIIDLRSHPGHAEPDDNDFPLIIILNAGARLLGMIVDCVSDVINLNPAQLTPVAPGRAAFHTDELLGMADLESGKLVLLDVTKWMAGIDIDSIVQLAA